MAEPTYENIKISVEKERVIDTIKAECRTDIESQNVKKILCVTPRVFGVSHRVKDSGIEYNGKIVFYTFYLDNENKVKKSECANEFLGVIKGVNSEENTSFKLVVTAGNGEYNLSGINVVLATSLTVTVTPCERVETKAFVSGEGIVTNNAEITTVKSFGVKTAVCPIEEEFEIPFAVLDVLSQKAEVIITASQSGVGCIIVDGEVCASMVLLQKNDKGDIIKEGKKFPFRIEIEHDDALPSAEATVLAQIKGLNTDVQVDEEGDKSVARISLSVEMQGEVFFQEEKTVADDLFCPAMHLDIEKKEYSFYTPEKICAYSERTKGRASLQELPAGSRVIAVCDERVEIVSYTLKEQSVIVEGVLSMNVLFRDGENNVFCVKTQTPFEKTLANSDCVCDNLQIEGVAENSSARLISLSEIELDCVIRFTLRTRRKQTISVITAITEGEKREVNDSAISVYIPLANESLWSLSKRLCVCPDDLLATNKDLQFPLTGKERIVVYRQK